MKVKKTIEIAFGCSLFILSVVASIVESDLFSSIIYSIVIPSFLLTITSFINKIIEQCRTNSAAIAKVFAENGALHSKKGEAILSLDKITSKDAQELEKEIFASTESLKSAVSYQQMETFFGRTIKVLSVANVVIYTLLFLSMILSPYIMQWLANVNLNCITLWSLTILYIDSELGKELCTFCFSSIARLFIGKKRK